MPMLQRRLKADWEVAQSRVEPVTLGRLRPSLRRDIARHDWGSARSQARQVAGIGLCLARRGRGTWVGANLGCHGYRQPRLAATGSAGQRPALPARAIAEFASTP